MMNKHSRFLLLSVLVVVTALHLLYLLHRRAFLEDGIIENIQALLLLVAAVSAGIHSTRTAWKDYAWLYRGVAIATFILLLEELSYGQRIIGFATPAFMKTANMQGEFNLHNLGYGLVDRVVMGTIGIGSATVLVLRFLERPFILEPRVVPRVGSAVYVMLMVLAVYYYASGVLIFAVRVFPAHALYMELHEVLLYWVLVVLLNTPPSEL